VSTEDVNRSRLARGLAMATLLWVLCTVLGIPFKLAATAIVMAIGGMLLKEVVQDKRANRPGGRGPHGGVPTTARARRRSGSGAFGASGCGGGGGCLVHAGAPGFTCWLTLAPCCVCSMEPRRILSSCDPASLAFERHVVKDS
jgi:hypothetical protein